MPNAFAAGARQESSAAENVTKAVKAFALASRLTLVIILAVSAFRNAHADRVETAEAAYAIADAVMLANKISAREAYRKVGLVLNVRDYGAVGDGKRNDTTAFQRAAAEIQRAGGGTILIPPGVYVVGRQTRAARPGLGYGYRGQDIISLVDCKDPVRIIGRKASLRLADGLKFGSFHPVTEQALTPEMPFVDRDYQATIGSMISVERCVDVEIAGLELDGNSDRLQLGGMWGDTGWQIPAIGIFTSANERLRISDVNIHHHALDGIQIGHPGLTLTDTPKPHTLVDVTSDHNGRQGLSWVGGNSLSVIRSQFNHNGKGRISSSPGAGIDVEAENAICRNGVFIEVTTINNNGSGFVADSGDSADLLLVRCLIWGTTNWSVWSRKPNVVLVGCEIYGDYPEPYVNAADPISSTRFIDCIAEDREHPIYGVYRYYRRPPRTVAHFRQSTSGCDERFRSHA